MERGILAYVKVKQFISQFQDLVTFEEEWGNPSGHLLRLNILYDA